MPRSYPTLAFVLLIAALNSHSADSNWPQFRGPGGLGIAGAGNPPVHFGPKSNVVWQVELPTGHSSPCIWGQRIFLTGHANGKLETLCLDRKDGRILWRATAPAEKVEQFHRIGSPAASTPCTDGERVYVYFGSFGLLAYDFDGNEKWRKPLPFPIVEFGAGTSPLIAGEKLILVCDQDMNSFLLAVDKRSGKDVWRTDRSEFRRGFSSPFLWKHGNTEELVVAGSLWVKSYDPKDGKERWSARGMARVANASPVSGDGLLIVSSWNVGGDEGDRIAMPPFEQFAAQNDKDKNGTLAKDEFPAGPFKDRFSQIDVNKDGIVTRKEFEDMGSMFERAENQVFAIKPGGRGDITDTHVVWKINRHLPYVSSPLCVKGRVYTIKDGGLASCYDTKTGSISYQAERLDAEGSYYTSAITADGRIYAASQKGRVVVYETGDTLTVLARNDMGEQVFATPAILDGRIYLRTEKRLFCFGR